MARTIALGNLTIIFRPLIDVFDHQRNRRAGRLAFKHPRQDPDLIRFPTLGREAGLPRPTAIKPRLDVRFGQLQAGWTAIYDAANGWSVAFTPGGNAKELPEAVV